MPLTRYCTLESASESCMGVNCTSFIVTKDMPSNDSHTNNTTIATKTQQQQPQQHNNNSHNNNTTAATTITQQRQQQQPNNNTAAATAAATVQPKKAGKSKAGAGGFLDFVKVHHVRTPP